MPMHKDAVRLSAGQSLVDRSALKANAQLSLQLVRREISTRYRGTVLGVVWSLLTPLMMLAVFTFVFGTVFRARWSGMSDTASTGEFAVILFAGLIIFQFFAEVVSQAPSVMLANQNYVKKVVFPLETLIPVAVGSALFHFGVSLIVLISFIIVVFGGIPSTALLAPVVLVPLVILLLGLGWFLASFGTYVRDIGQVIGTLVTAMMFLSPIFFPLSSLPDWIQPFILLNPISIPVTEFRNVMVFGTAPAVVPLLLYTIVAAAIAWLGYTWFQKTKKGFADVL
ncbi:MAG: ABC transporter permease [Pseudomonadota bacterium]